MAGMQDLARVGEPEFEEVQELELRFSEDLERVFEGKQADFGDHLRGMLFELWSRARGAKSDIVKELEELRMLRAEKTDLEAMIAKGIKAQLPAVAEQFRSTFDNVMATNLGNHLGNELEFPTNSVVFDDALATALTRVINPGEGLEILKEYGKLTIKSTVTSEALPEFKGQDDEVQLRLRERLRHEGLMAPEAFHEAWKWAPVFINTESGQKAAFQLWNWQEQYNADSREVRVPLAWDGSRWCFPNPRPQGNQHHDISQLENTLAIYIDGVEQSSNDFYGWAWDWTTDQTGAWVVSSVSGLFAYSGNELVEARYRVVERLG